MPELDRLATLIRQLQPAPVTPVSFAANWANYAGGGGAYADVSYYLCGKRVYLTGMAAKGIAVAAPDTIFTLPVGLRPVEIELFAVISNSALGRVDVNPDGTVQVQIGSNVWVSLCGLSFRVA